MQSKVILITDYFGPNPGGIENFLTGITKEWNSQRGDLIIICHDLIFYVSENEILDFNAQFRNLYRFSIGAKVNKYLPFISVLKTPSNSLKFLKHLLQTYIIKHIIFGNSPFFHKDIIRLIGNSQIPYSVILHPYDVERIEFYHRNLLKFLNQANNLFVYTNHFYELALIKGLHSEKVIKIPYGLNVQWDTKKASVRVKELIKNRRNKIKILSVGPITKKKNFERIFFVFEKLRYYIDISRIHWFIVGSGSETPFLREYIHVHNLDEYFTSTGFVNRNDIGFFYYNSDIYFYPGGNRKDPYSGFSTTLLEASYTALPIVSAMGAAVNEMVQNNVSGYIHREDDYEGMAYHLKELISNVHLRNRIGAFGEEKVNIEFSLERSFNQIIRRVM